MHVKTARFFSWLLVGLAATAVGCSNSSGSPAPGQTGGAGNGGVSGGDKGGSGGTTAAGGTTGGGSGGHPGTGGAATGGVSTTGRGGTTTGGLGGSTSAGGAASGGQNAGGSATGGKATGGSAGSQAGGASGGQGGGTPSTGGVATGGGPTTGGQGAGGKSTGGATGSGGLATAGGGQGGKATGGSAGSADSSAGGSLSSGGNPAGASGNGGGATAGASGRGGGATDGASGAGGSTSTYHPCPTDGTACKIMPFGDSITDGYNQDTPGGYRVELFHRALADKKNITFVGSGWNGPDTVDGVAFPHNHEGHSGWTIYPEGSRYGISYCLAADSKCLATNSVMLQYKPDIVLLMIGTNDCIDNYDMTNAPKRLGDLIDTIYTQLPDVLIVVAQPIPSRGDTSKGDDAGLTDRINTYDLAIPDVVKARSDAGKHILLVNMFKPFVDAGKASLIEDQWHPNLKGYLLMGDTWYDQALKGLL